MTLIKQYAYVLQDYIRTGSITSREGYATVFIDLLKRKGHSKLLPRIVKELEVQEKKRLTLDSAVLTVARESDIPRFLDTARGYISSIRNSNTIIPKIDERIIGGFVLETREAVVDASFKKMLLTLYKEIVV